MSNLLSIPSFLENGEQKSFRHFSELPPELCMMIVDKMGSDDRCRFAGSSKLCNKEAKSSKNYIYGLTINFNGPKFIVRHGNRTQCYRGYILKIVEEQEKMYLKCLNLRDRELWKSRLDISINREQFIVERFKNLLKAYHKTIKMLSINTDFTFRLDDIDSEVKSFNNLEELHVYGSDIRQFLSKLRKPLKSLYVYVPGETNSGIVGNCEQICQVQNTLELVNTSLNNQQLLQLSASEVKLPIGNLTEYDIFHFIRSWQNGTIVRKIKKYEWNLENSGFEMAKVFELFGKNYREHVVKQLDIQHEKEIGKVARLELAWVLLIFETAN